MTTGLDPARKPSEPLGELLVSQGVLTREQLGLAVEKQKASKGARLGRLVVELGYCTEVDVCAALAEQLHIPAADLTAVDIPEDVLKLLSKEIAIRYQVLPWLVDGRDLYLLMGDPTDLNAADAIAFHANLNVKPVAVPETDLYSMIARLHGVAPAPTPEAPAVDEFPSIDSAELVESMPVAEEAEEPDADAAGANEAPTIKLVNSIMADAIRQGASDIHIEPRERGVNLRYRVDGLLRQMLVLPKRIQPKLVSRIKIISHLDISERRKPQDGRTFLRVGGKAYDMRVSTLPTADGEKSVLRILAQDRATVALEDLGFDEELLKTWKTLLERPQGIVLVTGPTGSGKTSTLYASLNFLRSETTNIVTIEDPVEYRLEGINQVAVSDKAGMTFAAGLRSILRQDPDVVMVGEIRDAETAKIAFQAAQTGHLVLSTLHTNDAPSAVTRLLEMGIPSYLIASSVLGVQAQRLVRRLCDCKTPNPDGTASPRGCDACRFSGFRGRMGVHELMRITPKLRRALVAKAFDDELRNLACTEGLVPMFKDGLKKVARGRTMVEELRRVVPPDESDEAEAAPLSTRPASPAPGATGRKRVLVVDDDRATVRIAGAILAKENYEVVSAVDGHQALTTLYNEPPDLVLTDLNMPGMNGFDLVRRVRGDLALSTIPIILMSSDGDVEKQAYESGADDFITKPLVLEPLLAGIRKALLKAVLTRSGFAPQA